MSPNRWTRRNNKSSSHKRKLTDSSKNDALSPANVASIQLSKDEPSKQTTSF
tara:strand:- start:2700 stop:2855 length:156 start_codon:yes stop_codon:yes gene_type:complete